MYDIKPISRDAIPRAIQKAERYRLLNQSWAAESICLDVLSVEPDNQQVLVMMVLALTDLHSGVAAAGVKKAKEYLARITDDYQRAYYSGMVAERRGQALIAQGGMGSGSMAYDALRERTFGTTQLPWDMSQKATDTSADPSEAAAALLRHVTSETPGPLRLLVGTDAPGHVAMALASRRDDYRKNPGFAWPVDAARGTEGRDE